LPAADWSCGVVGTARCVRLPAADGVVRGLWAGPEAPALPPLALDTWRWLEVSSGVPRIVAATADQFVPQMLNLELLDGVSFKKGCYPGQEVVARSQYRGTIKRRMFLLEGASALAPGSEVYHDQDPGQPAGMVVLSAGAPDGRHAALVELKIAATQSGRLLAGGAEGAALRIATLPYAVDLVPA
jgi:tRNA-modifying protein YgfZ